MVCLPVPGKRQFDMKQNHANVIGSTGNAAFINDVRSIRISSRRGRGSSGGMVGAILCFLLFILVRRLSGSGFFRQQNNLLQNFEQTPLENK